VLAAGVFILAAALIGWFLPDHQPVAATSREPFSAGQGQRAKPLKTQ
jgi:hypothetical protein